MPAVQLLARSDYRRLWVDNLLWQMGRWMWMLVATYLVFRLTDSTFLTQVTGAALAFPQLATGAFSGAIADAFNRRTVLLANHVFNLGVAVLAAALVLTGLVAWWHVVVLSLVYGTFATMDQVTRGAFTVDLVGSALLPYAIALQGLAFTIGFVLGSLVGGVLLEVLPLPDGEEAAGPFLAIAGLCALGGLILQPLPSLHRGRSDALPTWSLLRLLGEGLRAVARNRAVIGVLGITCLFNLTFFTYMPLVPVFAQEVLHVNRTLMGLLGACQGIGAVVGTLFIATRPSIRRRSTYYIVGSVGALAFLQVFALSTVYPLSVAALIAAGAGTAGFATMQATLVLLSVPEEMRGRAMGLQNTAVGVLPLGMLALGALAQVTGPGNAVSYSAGVGFVLVLLWAWRAREMRAL